jgi:hypothetical protein
MSSVTMRNRRESERWLEQVQTWAGRSCLNGSGRQRKVDMKEISIYGTIVKVRPSTHLLENNSEEVDEEQRRVSSFVVNVPVKSNGRKGVTLSMTIFLLSESFLSSMAEPCSR